jgi:hypothetical protein
MLRAVGNGTVFVASGRALVVDGNHCFPAEALRWVHLNASRTRTRCVGKRIASDRSATVDGGSMAKRAPAGASSTRPRPTEPGR